MIDFFKSLHIPGTKIQFGELNKVVKYPDLDFPDNTDLYFVGNVMADAPDRRCKDEYIKEKAYVFFDFDLHNDYGTPINEICRDAEVIKEYLDTYMDNMLKDWSYIVYSGGGIHIYYLCDPTQIDRNSYVDGYKALVELWKDTTGLRADPACQNPSRMARIPGTFNTKRSAKSKILFESGKRCPDFIEKMQRIGQVQADIRKKMYTGARCEKMPSDTRIMLANGDVVGTNEAYQMAISGKVRCHAICHDDKTPSAFMWLTESKKLMYHCSACKKTLLL